MENVESLFFQEKKYSHENGVENRQGYKPVTRYTRKRCLIKGVSL